VAFTRAPENEGENQDISLETTSTLSLAGHMLGLPDGRYFTGLAGILLLI